MHASGISVCISETNLPSHDTRLCSSSDPPRSSCSFSKYLSGQIQIIVAQDFKRVFAYRKILRRISTEYLLTDKYLRRISTEYLPENKFLRKI